MSDESPDIRELGTPEAKALRAQASPEQVARFLRRVRELEAEDERRSDAESCGICLDSGLSIGWCWDSELCDCAYAPPIHCTECQFRVWDLADHERRRHP